MADATALLISALVTLYLTLFTEGDAGALEIWWVTVATIPVWLALFAHQRLYNVRFIGRRVDELRRIFTATLLGIVATALAGQVAGVLLRRSGLVIAWLVVVVVVTLEREGARRVFDRLRARGDLPRYAVIAGTNQEGRELAATLQGQPELGYQVLGFVDDAPTVGPSIGLPLLGSTFDLPEILADHPGATVIIASSSMSSTAVNRLARDLLDSGIHVELSSSLRDISLERLTVRPLGRYPVIYLEPVNRDGWRSMAKRAFDVTGALVTLLLTSPILLTAGLAVLVDSGRPILFRQTRVGRDHVPFTLLKMRSMDVDAESRLEELREHNEADGPLFKMQRDPRVTRVGRFLRATSIDELPQLWNVLRGDMSLVGPRPAPPSEAEQWDDQLAQRLRVKPGITGMWQVSGRSESRFADYTRLDLYYVDNWSLATDLAILVKTIPVVLSRRGSY